MKVITSLLSEKCLYSASWCLSLACARSDDDELGTHLIFKERCDRVSVQLKDSMREQKPSMLESALVSLHCILQHSWYVPRSTQRLKSFIPVLSPR